MDSNNRNSGLSYENMKPEHWGNEQITEWIQANEGLLYYIYHKFVRKGSVFFSREDVLQETYMAVVIAQKNFDSEKGKKFSTYATTVIKNHLLQLVRKEYTQKNTTPDGKMVASLNDDSWNFPLEDQLESKEPDLDDSIYAKELEQCFREIAKSFCTADENAILEEKIEYFYTGVKPTQKEIGKRLECSQSSVSGKEKKLKLKLITGCKERSVNVN